MPPELTAAHPLVGRVQELEQLASLVGLRGEAQSRAVVLAGDAGVGKTRLLTELRDLARGSGWRVVAGHCLDFGDSALPYLPFSEIFGRLAGDPTAGIDAMVDAHPAVRRLQPGRRLLSGVDGADGENFDRAELFEAVHEVFEELAERAPLLVLIEDVHWADQSTRDMLSFLFARQFSRPVAVVASYRSDDLHRKHPLRATAAQWSRTPGVARLQLAPLAERAVRELVHSLHPGALRESEMYAIVNRAEGNAFFVEELVGATEQGGPGLPDDLASLLLVRLDRLDESAHQVVRAASCAGRRVSHELLASVAGLEPGDLDRALRGAVEANILVPTGVSGYAFRHALLAEAVYDDLLPGERVRLHAAFTAALRSREVEGTAAELARHARAAHDVNTAVTASVQAGDEAMSVGGPDEAARHYELALELINDPSFDLAEEFAVAREVFGATTELDIVDLVAKTSDAVISAGKPYRALALVQDQLAQLSEETTDEERARLLLAFGQAALMGDTNVNALEATTEALGLLGPEPSKLRAKVLSLHALANLDRQREDEASRVAAEALELGRSLGMLRVVTEATTTLAKLDERAGDPESSRQALEKIVAEARANGHVAEELRGLHHLGALHFEAADLAEAAEKYSLAAERAAESSRPWSPYGLDARVMAGFTAYVRGHWKQATEIVDVTGQEPPGLAEAALNSVSLTVAAGRGEAAALNLFPRIRLWWERDGLVAILSGTAAIDLFGDRGDLDRAISVHDDIVATVSAIWNGPYFLARVRMSALLLGQLASSAARTAAAGWPALVRRSEDLVAAADAALAQADRRKRPMGPEGAAWALRCRAEHLRLLWITGSNPPTEDELVAAWQQTVTAFEEFGHRFETARSQVRLAGVLRAAGRAAEARELTDAARVVAHELDAAPLLTELRALGSQPSSSRGSSSRRDETLTAREQEILALVAQGRTNNEIGRQLFISAKTVSVHVSNILAKLGASGRTEAAAIARQRGLLSG